MTKPPDLTELSTNQLMSERSRLERLSGQRRAFQTDGHDTVERSVTAAKATVGEILANALRRTAHAAGESVPLPGLADAYILATVPDIAERWHALVDADEVNYSAPDRATFASMLDAWHTELRAINEELSVRREERDRQLAEAEAVQREEDARRAERIAAARAESGT